MFWGGRVAGSQKGNVEIENPRGRILRPEGYVKVAGMGFETTSKSSENTPLSEMPGAKSDVIVGDSVAVDSDLAVVVEAWPCLAEEVRKQILGVVQVARVGGFPRGGSPGQLETSGRRGEVGKPQRENAREQ